MNQKIVHQLADETAIYAYELSVSQADVPYAVTPNARPASIRKLSLYVDELTIVGHLVNPSEDINIVARVIHLQQPTVIDVGGSDPIHTYAPGDLPLQTNTAPGDPGVSGLDASPPGASGNLIVAAGSVDQEGASGSSSTTVQSIGDWISTAFATAPVRSAATAAVQPLPIAFQLASTDVTTVMNTMLDVVGAVIVGADAFTLSQASLDPATDDVFVDLAFSALTLGGTAQLMMDGIEFSEPGPLTSPPFGATVRLHLAGAGGAAAGQRVTTGDGIQITWTGAPPIPIGAATHASLNAGLLAALSARLSPVLATAVSARGSVSLTLLAQGGNGGRGQDGQSGIVGKSGIAGFTPAGSRPGLVDNGILIEYPAEAEGTAGTNGGAAGNAGHSTPASPGGRIAVSIGTGTSVQVLASTAGGRGGDAAVAGAPGAGGTGGAGSDIEVYVAGEAPGTVEDWVAPSGKDGDPGAAPTFTGATAADAAAGSLTCNDVPLTASTTITVANDAAVALRIPLGLLLICDQGNAVDHLNAQTSADFTSVIARYRWLAAVTEPFLNGADPSKGAFSATDIAVRRAMNQSVKLELARLAQGLDYYGEVVNWVPVLSMAALQSRVTSLLGIGQIVETTYNSYQASTATSETQLSMLDTALAQLQTKLSADQSTIAQLAAEIPTAEAQVTASLAPIMAQQNRLAVAEFDFREEFIAYVLGQATGCTFLNVLKGIFCIVEFAAEAVVGLGEISELTEAATLYEFASGIVKVIKTAEAEIEAIQKAVESIQSLLDTDVDVAKIVVDEDKFDAFIAGYLGKFPAATELADAVHQYFALVQTHNKLALAYTGLVVRQARLQATVAKTQSQIEAIAAQRAIAKSNEVLPEYTAFMTAAYWDLKADLLRELFEFNRAYTYWSLTERPFFASDETIANLAVAYAGWAKDIDAFLEQTGPVQPFTEQINITSADYPEAFALLAQTRALNVNLDIKALAPKYFSSMTHIVATTLKVTLPDIHPTTGAVLIELSHSGLAVQNSGIDLTNPANLHTFSHARRTIPYKIDYGNPANTAGGLIGDAQQGFPGLSPFTMWEISFDIPGNEWLDVTQIKNVELTLTGTFLLDSAQGSPPEPETEWEEDDAM